MNIININTLMTPATAGVAEFEPEELVAPDDKLELVTLSELMILGVVAVYKDELLGVVPVTLGVVITIELLEVVPVTLGVVITVELLGVVPVTLGVVITVELLEVVPVTLGVVITVELLGVLVPATL